MDRRPDVRHGPAPTRAPVDWQEVRRRVEEAGASLVRRRSPEEERQLLETRARGLAEPERPPANDTMEAIRFRLAGETYAVEAGQVSGVFPLSALTTVPGASDPVVGITEWRGDLLTVLDLRRLLHLPVTGLNDQSTVIALGGDRPAFGILADSLVGLVSIITADLYRPERGVAAASSHVHGLTQDAVIVLNAESLLASSPSRSD